MSMRVKNTIFLFVIFIITSCSRYPDNVEHALNQAGDNRSELERVLEHYRKYPADSLKFRAAEFLIANMPGHYSYANPGLLDAYYDEADTVLGRGLGWQEIQQQIEEISGKYAGEVSRTIAHDINIMTSGYLIDNIERAFDAWQNGGWATHVGFTGFCEYILPYKGAELQALDHWREYGRNLFHADLDVLPLFDLYRNSAWWACTSVNKEIIQRLDPQIIPEEMTQIPLGRISTLAQIPYGTCGDFSLLALCVMRSKGIPVAEDFTPQWPFRSLGHSWNVVLANSGKNVVFAGAISNPGEPHKADEKMAKVFRQCYAINPEIVRIQHAEKYVPSTFRNYFIKDVTCEYMEPVDVEIKIPQAFRKTFKYAYLAVFDNQRWVPVHWGKVDGKKVRFEKMGKNVVYLPVYCTEKGVVPFSDPFLLTSMGEIYPIAVDNEHRQTMTVNRKYHVAPRVYEAASRLVGGKLQVASHPDFRDSLTLYRFSEWAVQSGEVMITDTCRYRYWRYYSAPNAYCNMADLYFREKGSDRTIRGRIIGTEGVYNNQTGLYREAVFDGDPLTYFDAPEPDDTWVGMDFGRPVSMNRVLYVFRGDGNCVTPGDTYELLYWAGDDWISFGERLADDIRFVYENVPSKTLYWLRDLTTGKEERPFTYENGKQIWW